MLTLDAAGDPNAVWVFQAGSTLITASGCRVVMLNGAQACNVYWQVGSRATLGTNSTLSGTILALTSISLQTVRDVDGRALARNGAVTLDSNAITRSACNTGTSTTSRSTSNGATSAATTGATPSTTTGSTPSTSSGSTPSTPTGSTPSNGTTASPSVTVGTVPR